MAVIQVTVPLFISASSDARRSSSHGNSKPRDEDMP